MKPVLLLIIVFFCGASAFCQSTYNATEPSVEELKREILQMKEEQRQTQLHLHKAHREFRTGTIFYAIGFGLAVIAGSNENASAGLVLLGSGFLITGGILHIDSHKHIGRAGLPLHRRR
jgi:hypothetical protein